MRKYLLAPAMSQTLLSGEYTMQWTKNQHPYLHIPTYWGQSWNSSSIICCHTVHCHSFRLPAWPCRHIVYTSWLTLKKEKIYILELNILFDYTNKNNLSQQTTANFYLMKELDTKKWLVLYWNLKILPSHFPSYLCWITIFENPKQLSIYNMHTKMYWAKERDQSVRKRMMSTCWEWSLIANVWLWDIIKAQTKEGVPQLGKGKSTKGK